MLDEPRLYTIKEITAAQYSAISRSVASWIHRQQVIFMLTSPTATTDDLYEQRKQQFFDIIEWTCHSGKIDQAETQTFYDKMFVGFANRADAAVFKLTFS
jgi:hypothetical protein